MPIPTALPEDNGGGGLPPPSDYPGESPEVAALVSHSAQLAGLTTYQWLERHLRDHFALV